METLIPMECQLCGAMVDERTRIHLHSEHQQSIRLVCTPCATRYVERGQAERVNANGEPMATMASISASYWNRLADEHGGVKGLAKAIARAQRRLDNTQREIDDLVAAKRYLQARGRVA